MLRGVLSCVLAVAILATGFFAPTIVSAQVPTTFGGDGHPIVLVQYAGDGKTLVAIDDHGHAFVWDLPAGTLKQKFAIAAPSARALAVTNDGSQLIVAGAGNNLYLLSATDGKEVAHGEAQAGAIHSLVISPDGTTIAAGSGAFATPGSVTLNATGDVTRKHIVEDLWWPSYAIAWSPDGSYLVSGGGRVLQPGEAWLLDGTNGKPVVALGGARDVLRAAAFAPDSKSVALAGREGAIRVYEVPSGKLLRCIAPATGEVVALSYLDDGKRIAAVFAEGIVRVWDAATGASVTSFCIPRVYYGQAAFSRDGKWLAIGTDKGEVLTFELSSLDEWRELVIGRHNPCNKINCETPNVLLIVADGLGYGDVGIYGQSKIQTPNLDRLALEGLRFTDYYAGGTTNAPSQCTLLTGLSTGHARIRAADKVVPLLPNDISVAEVLRNSTYATAAFGRWHCGDKDSTGAPFRQGFSEFYGFYTPAEAADSYPDAIWHNDQQVQIAENAAGATKRDSAGILAKAAAKYISDHRHDPFFVMVNFPQPIASADRADESVYAAETWPAPAKKYAASVTRLDAVIGALVQYLDDLNLRNDTLIIVTSDGGSPRDADHDAAFFNSAGGLRGDRGSLYEGGLRVPMIVRWPRRIRANSTTGMPAVHYDILPTLADLAGVRQIPRAVDGASLAPLFGGSPTIYADEDRPIYAEKHEGGFQQSVRFGQWKAVRGAPMGQVELFDLLADPAESKDIAAALPEQATEAARLLQEGRTPSTDWPVAGEK